MHIYYFLTSHCTAPDLNAGSHLISDGIKELVRRADPNAILQDVTLFSHSKETWTLMLSNAKGIFLCGNPRFDPSETRFFWLTELLELMKAAKLKKVKVGDLFLGTASPLPLKGATAIVDELMEYDRNKDTLNSLKGFDLIVTRDFISQMICKREIKDSLLLPDSTFWAKDFYGVFQKEKAYNCVTIPSLNCSPKLILALYKLAQRLSKEKTTYFLCHAKNEYWIAKKTVKNIQNLIIIYDPRSLLEFYSGVDKLICCRIHGAIPALSLGAKVMNIAMDSRALAYDVFGFKSMPYTNLKNKDVQLRFDLLRKENRPSALPFVKAFIEKIMR